MSPNQKFFLLIVLLVLAAAAGCGGQAAPTGEASITIDSLEVLPQEEGVDLLMVIVRGHTDNNCLTVTEERIVQTGNVVEIVPQTLFTAEDECKTGKFSFDHPVSILASTLPEGVLTIRAGMVETEYTPPGYVPTKAEPTEAAPTEAPTTEPTEAEPTTEPTSEPEPTATPAASKDCIDKAAFYADVTVPDGTPFDPEEEFTKTWKVRNEGSCTWNNYELVFDNGDLMSAETINPIPSAAPGEIIDISIEMTAPSRAGAYTGNWQFRANNGATFGLGSAGEGLLWVKIGVRSPGGGGTTTTTTTTTTESCNYERQTDAEAQVLSLINDTRASNGLGTLTLNSQLSAAAVRHSADMACQDFVGHNGSDGSTWYTRIEAEGMSYTRASENIYVGSPSFGGTPQGAFDWWMNSQVHRDNILDASFTKIGIGYVYSAGSSYGGYYTLVFSRP